jgi:hypothetical protein
MLYFPKIKSGRTDYFICNGLSEQINRFWKNLWQKFRF